MATAARSGAGSMRIPTRPPAGGGASAAPTPLRERRPDGPPRRSAGTPARPRPRARFRPHRAARARSSRVAAILDQLLRGRAWVALIGLLLTGIVFLNVGLLELNGGIARTDARAADFKRETAALRMRVARLASSERIRRAAGAHGFEAAEPGRVGYLRPGPDDSARAARALGSWRPSASPGEPRSANRAGAPSTDTETVGTATSGPSADRAVAPGDGHSGGASHAGIAGNTDASPAAGSARSSPSTPGNGGTTGQSLP
jgi:hypothetical protein